MIMVGGLPAGCRLTAIFDVSNLESSRLDLNCSAVLSLWLSTRYESSIFYGTVGLKIPFLDLPYTVRARHQVDYILLLPIFNLDNAVLYGRQAQGT